MQVLLVMFRDTELNADSSVSCLHFPSDLPSSLFPMYVEIISFGESMLWW
jgi:hypothetical protein